MTDESAYVRAYARALHRAARITATLPSVQCDLAGVMGALTESVELRRWICRPVIASPVRRANEAHARFAHLVTPMTLRLLLRMAAWNHLHLLPAVTKRFAHTLRKEAGCRTVRLVSAQAPAPATLAAIRQHLGGECAETMDVELHTDPTLLAGMTIQWEDQIFDASLAGRIARLRQSLTTPGRTAATPTTHAVRSPAT
jgi:F-type H+-transporting ATPase subunit delta